MNTRARRLAAYGDARGRLRAKHRTGLVWEWLSVRASQATTAGPDFGEEFIEPG
jgi:hypothetical protein